MTKNRERKSLIDPDPVAFLVRFIEADLNSYRRGDWSNLQDDLAAFSSAAIGSLAFGASDEQTWEALGAGVIRSLQDSLREILRPIAESQSTIDPQSQFGRIVALQSGISSNFSHHFKGVSFTVEAGAGNTPFLKVSASQRELVFMKAALLLLVLRSSAQTRLRVCPECGSVFLRVRKQLYCTPKCVDRANMRAWLGRPNGKASHKASSRRSYAKRVRAGRSENLRIGRRKEK